MASKRIAQSAVNWAGLAERVPSNQRASFLAFKGKSDSYLKRVMANPEKPPKIDWTIYKTKVPVAGMVDSFMKSYEALSIPYPPDTVTKAIDDQEVTIKNEVADFKKESNNKIGDYKGQLSHLHSLIPFDQMTMEDFKDSYPEMALDPIKRPTFWPHDEEEQTDYTDKGHPLYGHNPHDH